LKTARKFISFVDLILAQNANGNKRKNTRKHTTQDYKQTIYIYIDILGPLAAKP